MWKRFSGNFAVSPRRAFQSRKLATNSASLHRVVDYDFSTLWELKEKAVKYYPTNPIFGTKNGSKFDWITYSQFSKEVQLFRNVLLKYGVKKNDKVAVISNNRLEWAIAMYGAMSLGAQWVPMYEAQLEKDWKFILNDCEADLLLVANEALQQRVQEYVGNVGKIRAVISFDGLSPSCFKPLMTAAASEPPSEPVPLVGSDLLTFIYTSGTTGNPKGVVLSHANIVSNISSIKSNRMMMFDNHTHVSLAYLPWAHIYGQTAELYALMATGSAMAIVSRREEILESIQIVKPTIICSVPMLLNRVYDGVMKRMADSPPLRRKLFEAAMRVARKRNQLLMGHQPVGALLALQHRLADKVVLSKVRQALGGNVKLMTSGGAATGLPVLEFFEDIGVPICEGYGLTETAPCVSASASGWDRRRLGYQGVVLEGVTVRIVNPASLEEAAPGEEGEVCCAGGNVMVGYHNNPQATAEVIFHRDGLRLFRTGDLGRIVDGKFLKITGRIKEQYKLANGKYVVPGPLEDIICRSPLIAQAFLFGDNKPNNVLLVVPDILELRPWAVAAGLLSAKDSEAANLATLLALPAVTAALTAQIEEKTRVIKSYERPARWLPLADPFTQDNQLLTPKMSMRRNNILKKYSAEIEDLYVGDRVGVGLPRGPQE